MKAIYLTITLVIVVISVILAKNQLYPEDVQYSTLEEDKYKLENIVLERKYPSFIKGSVDPGTPVIERIFRDHVDSIKELGVNTISIYPYHRYENGKILLGGSGMSDDEKSYMWLIQEAKKKGFAVSMSISFVGQSGQKFENVSMEKYLSDSKEVAIKWAKIAEQQNVEYFAPQGELGVQLFINYFSGDWGNATELGEVVKIVNKWYEEILPEIKKVYSGKTVLQEGLNGPSFRINNLQAKGYDYIAIDFNQASDNLEQFRERVKQLYGDLETVATSSNSGWFIAEAWFPHSQFGLTNADGESYDGLQDDYYRVALEELENFNGNIEPSGFMYVSYMTLDSGIKERPAESVIKEFYQKLN